MPNALNQVVLAGQLLTAPDGVHTGTVAYSTQLLLKLSTSTWLASIRSRSLAPSTTCWARARLYGSASRRPPAMTVARSSCCFGTRPLIEAMISAFGGRPDRGQHDPGRRVQSGEVFQGSSFSVFLFGLLGRKRRRDRVASEGTAPCSKGTTQAPAPGARKPSGCGAIGGETSRSLQRSLEGPEGPWRLERRGLYGDRGWGTPNRPARPWAA